MRVYWITGFAGAGKTTIARLLYKHISLLKKNVVLLDGDALREIMGGKDGYKTQDRLALAYRYAKLSRMLSEQNIDVIIATISMFDEVRKWNRENISNYLEIYIKVPAQVLIERDQKNLYSKNIENVVGFNIKADEPKTPDIVLLNDSSKLPNEILNEMLEKINKIQ